MADIWIICHKIGTPCRRSRLWYDTFGEANAAAKAENRSDACHRTDHIAKRAKVKE